MKPFQNLLFCIFIANCLSAQPVNTHGQLQVSGTALVNRFGTPIALHGMSFGWHNWHPRFYNAAAVKELFTDWSCSVVRVAMGVEPEQGYIKAPAASVEKIKAVVDAAIKEGIYVIIDWHSHNINLNEAKQFFSEMALAYGKYPNVLYEIFNEPDQESWKEVKAYSIELIKTIRAIDPDNIILVGSPHWDQDIHLPAEDPIQGYQNLMYTLHFYAGTHKQWLRNRTDEAIRAGLPVFVSECAAMEASGNGPLDDTEWQNWVSWMDGHNLSWINWSVSDKNETCSVLNTSANSNGNWRLTDLKESGVKIREQLRKYPPVKK